jgi:hypothetical protein
MAGWRAPVACIEGLDEAGGCLGLHAGGPPYRDDEAGVVGAERLKHFGFHARRDDRYAMEKTGLLVSAEERPHLLPAQRDIHRVGRVAADIFLGGDGQELAAVLPPKGGFDGLTGSRRANQGYFLIAARARDGAGVLMHRIVGRRAGEKIARATRTGKGSGASAGGDNHHGLALQLALQGQCAAARGQPGDIANAFGEQAFADCRGAL